MKLKLKQAAIVSLAAFIILITCFGVLLQGNVYAAEKQKKVLFISSYSLSYPTVSQQIAGIKEGLDEDVYIYYEFMDGKTISDDAYIDKFYDYIYSFGFGTETNVGIPSEDTGEVVHRKYIRESDLSRIAFGENITTTAMQMANAFCAVINGGTLMQP